MTKTRRIGSSLVTITGLTEDVDTLMNAVHTAYKKTGLVPLIAVAMKLNMVNLVDASTEMVA